MTEDRSEALHKRLSSPAASSAGARREASGASVLAAASSLVAVFFAVPQVLAPSAMAAEFRLTDGGAIDGVVTHASARHVALRAEDGVHLINRDVIESVTVDGADGQVSGRFLGWNGGLYRVGAEGGDVELADVDEPAPARADQAVQTGAVDAAPTGAGGEGAKQPADISAPAVADAQPVAPLAGSLDAAMADPTGEGETSAPGLEIFDSPEIDHKLDAFRVKSEAPVALGAAPAAADPAAVADPLLTELARSVASVDDDLQAPRLANSEQLSGLAKGGVAGMVAPTAPAGLRAQFKDLGGGVGDKAALAQPDRAERIDSPTAPIADAAPDDAAQRSDPSRPDEATAEAVVIAAAEPGRLADPLAKAAEAKAAGAKAAEARAAEVRAKESEARRDVAAQLSQPTINRDADAAMRGMLTNLIFGDGEMTDSAAETEPEAAADAGLAAEKNGASGADAGVGATVEATLDAAEKAKPAEAKAETAQAQAAVSVARSAATKISVAEPSGPLPDPVERDFEQDYRLAVTGAIDGYAPAVSCSRIVELDAAPGAFVAGRADPAALIVATPSEIPPGVTASLAQAWYEAEAVASAPVKAASAAVAAAIGQPGERLIRARRVVAIEVGDSDASITAVTGGQADVGLVFGGGGYKPEHSVLIGFDALAMVAHPDNPTPALTARDIAGLLSGKLSDWSMIEPTLIGAPTLYLPPEGSASLAQLAEFAGVRRVRPASVRFIPDPVERVKLALADPKGLAFATLSAIGDAKPTPIGRAGKPVAPSLDTLRSGAYPLPAPVYLRRATPAAHPFSAPFADFLTSPIGQRSVFEAGLTPVAACDPSSCRLRAPGLDESRQHMASFANTTGLTFEQDKPVEGVAVARFVFPGGEASTPPSVVQEVADFIRLYGAHEDWRDHEASVAVARGEGDESESLQWAAIRAESVALALRCAGIPANRVIVGSHAGDAGRQHQVDVLLK